MPKKFILGISDLLIFTALIISGCAIPSTSEITPPTKIDYLADSDYFLYRIDWLDQDRLIGMMCQSDMKCNGNDLGRIIVWYKTTDSQQLIYEGNELVGFMPDGIVFGEDGIYAFDSRTCLLIDEKTLTVDKIIRTQQASCPSVYGDLTMRTDDGMGIIKHDDPDNLITLLKDQTGVTEDGITYTIFYEMPGWSPDGKWITFYKMTDGFIVPPQVSIIDSEGNNEKNYIFDTASNFAWSPDSKNLVLINDGSIFGPPLEIRIENIETGEEIIELFDQPIDGQKIYFLDILDIFDTKILLEAYFDYNEKHVRPVLLYDWATKEKKWITELDTKAVSVVFSPDGKTIAVTGSGSIERNRIVLFNIE